jgi:DNA-binding CsgD family transcriptional regulator
LTLVGRAREQSLLADALEGALAGHGSLVLLSGEAGIGKTALALDTARAARVRGALVLTGHCFDLTETPPYGPWMELFDSEAPAVGVVLPSSTLRSGAERITSQSELQARVRDSLQVLSAERPLVLILDDLHWADEASLDLLRYLARHLTTLPVLILGTYRVEEITHQHPLYSLLPQVVREATPVRIDLRRLGAADVRALARRRYMLTAVDEDRLVEHLLERGEGNPFYIGELLRAYEEQGLLRLDGENWSLGDVAHERLPRLLRQVIDVRLARLGDDASRLLAVAAVIGQDVPLSIWASVAGVNEDALLSIVERAVEARVLEEVPTGARVRFVHALLREALYEGLLGPRRRAWHRRVAEALAVEELPDPVAVAYHFRQAEDPREVEWLIQAGARARAVHVSRVAIDHLTRALHLARRGNWAPTFKIHRERGLAYQTLGEFASARADLEAALGLAHADDDRHAEWQAMLDLGYLWEGQDYSQAGEYLRQALGQARAMVEPRWLAHSLNRLGNWHSNVEEPLEGQRCHREALGVFREIGDRHGIATTLDLLGTALFLGGDKIRAAARFRESLALTSELDDRQTRASSLSFLAACGVTYGHESLGHVVSLAEEQDLAEQALELSRELDSPPSEAFARIVLAHCLGLRGLYAEALPMARHALALAQKVGHQEWTLNGHHTLGSLLLDLGMVAEAQDHLESALRLAREVGTLFWQRTTTTSLAVARIAQGEIARSEDLLTDALGSVTSLSTLALRSCWYARSALAVAKGDPAAALEIIDTLIDSDPSATGGRASPYLMKLRAEALVMLKRPAEAEAALIVARETAWTNGARPLLWRVDAALAALYCREGRLREAEQTASAARALVAKIAADLSDDETRNAFVGAASALIPDTSVPRAVAPAGLSNREAEVLRLLAEGLSNAEIADRLIVSVRTINTHLTSVYAKLGVSSRSAAVRYAIDHHLV